VDTHKPICPRCAYDLSGIVESWKDTCPLAGTCSECGLEFTWHAVLRGHLRLPAWSFEHAPPGRRFGSFFKTFFITLMPRRLWRGIRLEMQIRPGRLILFALLGFLSLRLLAVVTLQAPWLLAQGLLGGRYSQLPDDPWLIARDLAWPYPSWYAYSGPGTIVAPWVLGGILICLFLPLTFFLLPISLRRAKVRPAHIARITAYNLAFLPLMIGVFPLLMGAWLLLCALTYWEVVDILGWGWPESTEPAFGVASIIWTLALVWRFWKPATRDYLRLNGPTGVVAAMLTIATLASAVIVVLLYGPDLFW
jgi:hypothetical protein